MIFRDVRAEINLNAIQHNFTQIRKLIQPPAKFCAVVKANAYGHGSAEISKIAVNSGADFLAVATVDEAIFLRKNNFSTPILILGLIPQNSIEISLKNDISLTVSDFDFAKKISDSAKKIGKIAKIHLAIDTGMGRIGIFPQNAVETAKNISNLSNIDFEGIFSHFADTDDKIFTLNQLDIFKKTVQNIKNLGINIKIAHIAESAAILEIPQAHLDMVRAGIISYGLFPSDKIIKKNFDLCPAFKLIAKIVFIKKIKKNTPIGYGREFIAKNDSIIATLPIGYADGYIRAYKNFFVEINGKIAPIAGRICMDQFMVDVTDIPNVKVGDEAILFGSDKISIDDAANHLKTINYEITCMISNRVPRIYV